MQLKEDDPQVQLAVLGEVARNFKESMLGKYLIQCAEADAKDALDRFMNVDIYDAGAIADIKVKLLVAKSFETWLDKAIIKGSQAFQLEDE